MARNYRKKQNRSNNQRELRLYHFWPGPEQPPVNQLIALFTKKHPGVRVSQNILEWWVYAAAMPRHIARGMCDVMITEAGQMLQSFASVGLISELTEIWEENSYEKMFPEWISKRCMIDGEVYGIPAKLYTFCIWYKKEIFKSHGLKPPETWDEFIEICERLKKTGLYPIISGGDGTSDWLINILARVGGKKFYDGLVEGRESWIDSRVITSYEMLRDISRDFFYPHPFGLDWRTAFSRFNAGAAAMMLQGDWVNTVMFYENGYRPGVEYDCFPLPPVDRKSGQVMVVGGNAWVVPRNSEAPDLAREFIEFTCSSEAQNAMARFGMGIMPTRVPARYYNPITRKLIDELKGETVYNMSASMPKKLRGLEQLLRMRIVLNPHIEAQEIKDLMTEMEIAAKEHHTLKGLSYLGMKALKDLSS
ncbi:MAG: extracellular solute-binding protein [Candidatus Hadarchaeales archaeon]